jgi:hypothetical protein
MKPNTQQLNDLTIKLEIFFEWYMQSTQVTQVVGLCRISCSIISKYNGPQEGFEMDGIGERPFLPFKRAYFSCFLQRFSEAVTSQ